MSPKGATPALFGRAEELSELLLAVKRRSSVVVVEGEPGSGKTRLLGELLCHPETATTAVLSASCRSASRSLSLGPLIHAVEQAASLLTPHAAGLSPVTGVLRPLLPELGCLLPPTPRDFDPEVTRHQTFRALREITTVCGPTLLVLDDVEHADEDTLEFLSYLVSSLPSELTVVVGVTERPAFCATPVSRLLRVHRDGSLTRIPLHRWDRSRVEQLAKTVLADDGLPADFVTELLHRSGGLPGAVQELLADLSRFRSPRAALTARLLELGVPALTRDKLRERVASLGSPGNATLAATAVLAESATEEALVVLTGLPESTVAEALEAALSAVLLVEVGPGRYGFRYPLARDAVYESIPGPRRQRLHAQAALFLAARNDPPLAELAEHHRLAGEIEQWVHWTTRAVERATEDQATDELLSLLERVLDDPHLPRAAREKFALWLSREMHQGLMRPGTLRRLRAIVREWPLSKATRGEIRMNLGRALINQSGQVDAGRLEIELATADLSHHRAALARGLVALAMPHVGTVPLTVNLQWMAQAEQAGKGVRNPEVIAAVRANRVSARMQVADPGVWPVIERLPQAPPSPEERRQVSRTYINLADAAAWNGHYAVARSYLATARRLVHDDHQPYLQALAAGTELRLDVATGSWSDVVTDARRLIDQVGDTSSLAAEPLLALGWLDVQQSRPMAALRNFDDAFTLSPASVPFQASAFAGRAAIALAAGDVQTARSVVEYGLDCVRRKENWVWASELMPLAVRALLAAGNLENARGLLVEYEQAISGRDAPLAQAAAVACQGFLARAEGRVPAAMELLRHAGQAFRELPQPYAAAKMDEAVGACHVELGDFPAAVELLAAAERAYDRLPAAPDAARCRRALRQYDSTLARRGRRGYGVTLSPRELEVAVLAARNLTNREIAEQLFLSPRTVEIHVGKALRKLGVSSRAVLGPALERHTRAG